MTKLILIRHGETDCSLERRYCGFGNPSLNKKGIRQAKRLAGMLKNIKVDKVYSSDLKRAHETADVIFPDNRIKRTEDFREMNFGIFEGLKYDQIIEKYPKLYKDWIDNPLEVKIPDGEGLKELAGRVRKSLSDIFSQHGGQTIAIVTHGGPIRVILCKVKKLDLDMFWHMDQKIGTSNTIYL